MVSQSIGDTNGGLLPPIRIFKRKNLVLRSLNEQIMKRFAIAICRYAVSSIDEKVETEGSSLHVTCFNLDDLYLNLLRQFTLCVSS
ncbi:unnamed protein product [Lactuca virosa]|uniref:Uncharacterized protein n=1 Tax=Lactuca virosa TaxID=75947 RepID=A0AAU9PKR3_9ASTR|nr:unnamed protein product [Lactuca virosa]